MVSVVVVVVISVIYQVPINGVGRLPGVDNEWGASFRKKKRSFICTTQCAQPSGASSSELDIFVSRSLETGIFACLCVSHTSYRCNDGLPWVAHTVVDVAIDGQQLHDSVS